MSKIAALPKTGTVDKRIHRTREALAKAIIGAAEKGQQAVLPAGELAKQAGISRSTFYAHFKSRDDYLQRAFAGLVAGCDQAQKRDRPGDSGILPSWHLFHHVFGARAFAMQMAASGELDRVAGARQTILRDTALKNLKSHKRKGECPQDGAATMIAGAFGALMRAWIVAGLKTPPAELHGHFENFVRAFVPENAAPSISTRQGLSRASRNKRP